MAKQHISMQRLLSEIEALLQTPQPRPWKLYQSKLYQQWLEQRQILLRTREILALLLESPQLLSSDAPAQVTVAVPQEALAEISQDLNQLRGNLLLPLQQEVQQLLQQRHELQLEIAQLEATAATYQQALSIQSKNNVANPSLLTVDDLKLQEFHDRATTLLGRLDSSIQLTFDVLDQDIETYRITLARKLEQLYDLGQRSETIVALLLQQIVEQSIDAAKQAKLPLNPTPNPELSTTTTTPLAVASISQQAMPQDTFQLASAQFPSTQFPSAQATPSAANIIGSLSELLTQLNLSPPDRPIPSSELSGSNSETTHESTLQLDGFNDLFGD